jgi:hypothetical protein
MTRRGSARDKTHGSPGATLGGMGTHSIKQGWLALAFCVVSCAEADGIDLTEVCEDAACVGEGGDDPLPDDDPEPTDDDDGPASDESESGDVAMGGIPCDVLDVLRSECLECHGDPLAFGAPMPLLDVDDLQMPALSDPTRQVHELVAERLVDEAAPMPPGATIEASDRDVLLDWVAAGAPEDPAASCDAPDEGEHEEDELPCEPDFVLEAHAAGSDDAFVVPPVDDLYMCFAFQAPFGAATHATAWAPIIDDERVVHHWILYRTKTPQIEGAAVPCDVSLQVSSQFVAGWAPGGGNMVMPDDVGLELGEPGDWYLLQVHYNNSAGHLDAIDRSGVAFCTADEPRPKTAGILTLGSLSVAIPPHAEDHEVTGTCSPLTTFLWPEMHLLGGSPHMHELGRGLRSEITRLGGQKEMLLDVPTFDFNSQGMYPFAPEIVVKPGDTITTTCTYDNPNDYPVLFGEGTGDEMCFNFVLAYPIDALLDRNCGILP